MDCHPTQLQLELGHAGEPVSAAVAAHLNTCPQCTHFVRTLEREREHLLTAEPPGQFVSRLERSMVRQPERWTPSKLRLGLVSSVTVAGTLAATAALAAIVAGAAHWGKASRSAAEPAVVTAPTQVTNLGAGGSSHAGEVAGAAVVEAVSPLPEAAKPRQLSMQAGNRLLAINPSARPYRVHVPDELAGRLEAFGKISPLLDICVTAQGSVKSVTIESGSIPVVDAQIPTVLSRWRYRPYLVGGKPEPFCYRTRYSIQAK